MRGQGKLDMKAAGPIIVIQLEPVRNSVSCIINFEGGSLR
jgi:hypothetical protein